MLFLMSKEKKGEKQIVKVNKPYGEIEEEKRSLPFKFFREKKPFPPRSSAHPESRKGGGREILFYSGKIGAKPHFLKEKRGKRG